MIRNERQYRVTQAERDRLTQQLSAGMASEMPAWARKANRDAIAAQVISLEEELADYDALRQGSASGVLDVRDLNDLPRSLIRARIAGQMTQRDLAEKLGLKEQQVQRYESTEYAGANLARLRDVMTALDVSFRGELDVQGAAGPAGAASAVRKTLRALGVPTSTASRRFFGGSSKGADADWMGAAARASRVFNASTEDILHGEVALLANAGSFRATSVVNRDALNGYAHYAEYLAGRLALACTQPFSPLPDAPSLHRIIDEHPDRHPLETLVEVCWDHGVPILPLSDSGAFHGACWFVGERPVIALKNPTPSADRWAFLLAHEMDHARRQVGTAVLEQDLAVREWRALPSERAADQFATDALLGEQAEALVQVTVVRASHDVARLKFVLPDVARAAGVSAGLLADHVAFRVGQEGIDWWSTANRLHTTKLDPWNLTRGLVFDHVDLTRLDHLDRDMVIDGLAPA